MTECVINAYLLNRNRTKLADNIADSTAKATDNAVFFNSDDLTCFLSRL